MICNECGSIINEGHKFCVSCGASIIAEKDEVQNTMPLDMNSVVETPKEVVEEEIESAPVDKQAVKQKGVPQTSSEKPLSVLNYMVTILVLCIPIVGPIVTLIWAFSPKTNLNKKNYARAILIIGFVGIVIAVVLGYFLSSTLMPLLEEYMQ